MVLASAPARADDAPRCQYVQVADLPIRYAGPGLQPAVDGSIDGTPATLLLDTSASRTFLTRNATEKRHLALYLTGGYVTGVSGDSRLYTTRVKEFGIGPLKTERRLELPVIGETSFVPAYDAIIGAPFLLQLDLEIELRDKRLKMFRPHDCDKAFLDHWSETVVRVPLERDYRHDGDNPHFTVRLNGHKLDAIIASGAARSAVTLDAAKRAGIRVDGPGVRRLPNAVGVGTGLRTAKWVAPLESFSIGGDATNGGETIHGGEIEVMDFDSDGPDVYLGQDFLRTHRVLLSVSQMQLYLAYLGGDVFKHTDAIEPWIRQEADAGNADARFVLARRYQAGQGVPRDPIVASTWLDLAAAQGQPQANLAIARNLMRAGHFEQAIPHIRDALGQLPAERHGELLLYLARVRTGQEELGKRELRERVEAHTDDAWPAPVADFYLGRISADALLKKAAKEDDNPALRRCEAISYIADWHRAHGDTERARALMTGSRQECASPAGAGQAAR
jgi:predicted aspartyl protease